MQDNSKNKFHFSRTFSLRMTLYAFIVITLIMVSWALYKPAQKNDSSAKNNPQKQTKIVYEPSKVLAVGDISCAKNDPKYNDGKGTRDACQQDVVMEKIAQEKNSSGVFLLGDIQYERGLYDDFVSAFEPILKPVSVAMPVFPVPGNHDYGDGYVPVEMAGKGYFDFFAKYHSEITTGDKGYYSKKIGKWTAYMLNSDCEFVACDENSEQYKWLASELEKNRNDSCSLMTWHHPVFTSGKHTDANSTSRGRPFWLLAEKYKVDVILNGHEHFYQRFSGQSVTDASSEIGPREFIIGTGGKTLYKKERTLAHEEAFYADNFGYLRMNLGEKTYDWEFVTIAGEVKDSGSSSCQ
jgi:predicted phosphodiesterase